MRSEQMAYVTELVHQTGKQSNEAPKLIALGSGVEEAGARQMMLGAERVTWIAMDAEANRDAAISRVAQAISE
jgi:hypothetical protein